MTRAAPPGRLAARASAASRCSTPCFRLCFALCLALFGCASEPTADQAGAPGDVVSPSPSPAPAPAPTPAPAPQSAYEQQQRDRALAFMRQKRLADAVIAWELLTVLRPDTADYRERLADAQRQIDAAVAERLPRAAQAAQRGELDNATQLYLAVLALQPLNEPTADALRALERERNKRSYLGKFSRATLTRREMADAEMPANLSAGSGGLAGRNEVEHAALLAGDGEFDDAISLLERRIVLDPKDLAARRLLADVFYRKAESLLPRDRAGALAALEKSARTYPADARAANRIKQLNSAAPTPAAASAAQVDRRPAR